MPSTYRRSEAYVWYLNEGGGYQRRPHLPGFESNDVSFYQHKRHFHSSSCFHSRDKWWSSRVRFTVDSPKMAASPCATMYVSRFPLCLLVLLKQHRSTNGPLLQA